MSSATRRSTTNLVLGPVQHSHILVLDLLTGYQPFDLNSHLHCFTKLVEQSDLHAEQQVLSHMLGALNAREILLSAACHILLGAGIHIWAPSKFLPKCNTLLLLLALKDSAHAGRQLSESMPPKLGIPSLEHKRSPVNTALQMLRACCRSNFCDSFAIETEKGLNKHLVRHSDTAQSTFAIETEKGLNKQCLSSTWCATPTQHNPQWSSLALCTATHLTETSDGLHHQNLDHILARARATHTYAYNKLGIADYSPPHWYAPSTHSYWTWRYRAPKHAHVPRRTRGPLQSRMDSTRTPTCCTAPGPPGRTALSVSCMLGRPSWDSTASAQRRMCAPDLQAWVGACEGKCMARAGI